MGAPSLLLLRLGQVLRVPVLPARVVAAQRDRVSVVHAQATTPTPQVRACPDPVPPDRVPRVPALPVQVLPVRQAARMLRLVPVVAPVPTRP